MDLQRTQQDDENAMSSIAMSPAKLVPRVAVISIYTKDSDPTGHEGMLSNEGQMNPSSFLRALRIESCHVLA